MYPWLSAGLLLQWCAALPAWAPRFSKFEWTSSLWNDLRIRQLFPKPEKNPFLRLMQDREQFLAALDRLPQTICHKDAYPTNLMACQSVDGEEETVALDWALAGVGPLGEELAQLALGALNQAEDAEAVDVGRTVFDGYLEGLTEMGWQGSADAVRFGFAASTALRMGLILLWTLEKAFQEGNVDDSGTLEQSAKQARFAADLAEEAYALLESAV
jgi:thiamine kinase-like enzyme